MVGTVLRCATAREIFWRCRVPVARGAPWRGATAPPSYGARARGWDQGESSSGSSSKATPAISSSSPAWNPSASSARITPILRRRVSR